MILTFADNSKLSVICVNASKCFFQNSNRNCLEIIVDPDDISFDSLRAIFSNPEKTASMVLDGSNLYEDYTLRVKQALETAVLSEATPNSPEITADRFIVVMAQKTYIEKALTTLLSK